MPKKLVETKLAQDLGECYLYNTWGGCMQVAVLAGN
jgi:hypothetical protein